MSIFNIFRRKKAIGELWLGAELSKSSSEVSDAQAANQPISDLEERDAQAADQSIDADSVSAAILQALGIGSGDITFEEAMEIPAVASSIDFIASICARVPVKLYRDNGEDAEEITDDVRIRLLNDDTGDLLNAFQMKKAWVTDYFNGQGYIFINRRRNICESLHYVEKQYISVNLFPDPIFKDADIFVSGGVIDRRFYPHDFLRLCRNTKNGVTGESIVNSNGDLLSLYHDTIKFESRLMNTGGGKKGFLTSENKLSDEVMEKMRETWRKVFDKNVEGMMILNKGIQFQEASATSTELQLNENKNTNATDIMLLFLLSSKALQGASDDEIVAAIKTACIPIIEQMEAAYNTSLLLEAEKKNMYFAADTSKLERGDILKRYQAYEIALRSHWLQPDEVRYEEDRKPLGLDFIQLGLNDVLYFPDDGRIYTPNTNQDVYVDERSAELRYSDNQARDRLGRFTSGGGVMHSPDTGGGFGGGSGLTDGSESGKISDEELEQNRKELKEALKAGIISSKLYKGDKNHSGQAKHKKDSEAYNDAIAKGEMPSYTELSYMEVQKIINEKCGTGEVIITKDNNRTQYKETITLDYDFGFYGDTKTETYEPTNRATIHYSKRGAHLVPARKL